MSEPIGPESEILDRTQREDASDPKDGLEKTEVDPYATAMPVHNPEATAKVEIVDTVEDPYQTRVTEASPEAGAASIHEPARPAFSLLRGSSTVSRYKAIRLHARGGLGEIFVALDGELNREVALKEIQEKHSDRGDSRYRFVFEAEVTGGLEHPGIVPVYGLGHYPDGRPYYAMRFIRGDSMKAAVKKLHTSVGPGSDDLEHSLDFRQLLTRFVAVCQAIDYAHSRGVIHRDLKPENVMLGPHGETLVVDWGLAKALDRPDPPDELTQKPLRPLSGSEGSATLQGSVIGTPSFMSPEQAEGEVETLGPPSDIFSLGSTLYNILTGQPPFQGKKVIDLLENVRHATFPAPREIKKAVPKALEAICLKAMALKAEDRYPTAAALAGDIERWLGDEPVSAYPEPILARVARWARRHRTLVAVGFALLLTGSIALGVGNVLIGRERARTERNFVRARLAVEEMLTKVGEVDLADVPQMEPVRRDLLARALSFYQTFFAEKGNSEWSQIETGRAYGRLGEIHEMMGLYVQAEEYDRQAIGSLRKIAQTPGSDPEVRRSLARARTALGILLKKSNRFVESEYFLRRAIYDRSILRDEHPDDPDDARALAAVRYQLGTLLARLKSRGSEDEADYLAAIKEQRDLIARPASKPEARRELARYLNNLGILQAFDRPAEATQTFRDALKIQDDLEPSSANNAGFRWQRSRTRNNLANLLARAGQADEAGPLYDQARSGLEALSADFPTVPDYRRELGMTLNNLGLLRESKPIEGSDPITIFRQALEDQRRMVSEFPEIPDLRLKMAITCLHLGDALRTSKPPEAEGYLREAVALQSKLVAEYSQVPEYLAALGRAETELALLLVGQGKPGEAPPILDSAIGHLKRSIDGNPREATTTGFLIEAHNDLAETFLTLGRHADLAVEAEALVKLAPDRPEVHVAAAKFLVRALGLVVRDPTLNGAGADAVAERYRVEAVKALRKAYEKGLEGPSTLDDPAFEPIRARPDFEKLRQDVKNGIKRAVV